MTVEASTCRVHRECTDAAAMSYADYLRLDCILTAQKGVSEARGCALHDEHFFIVLHQSHEIWFKQILVELGAVVEIRPERDDFFLCALPKLRRSAAIQKLLVQQISLLETLDRGQFLLLRSFLGNASGLQSVQFPLIEATMGIQRDLRLTEEATWLKQTERDLLIVTLRRPSLGDLLISALSSAWRRLERTPELRDFEARWSEILTANEAHKIADCSDETRRGGAACTAFERSREVVPPAFRLQPPNFAAQALPLPTALMALRASIRHSTDDTAICEALDAFVEMEDLLLSWRKSHASYVCALLGDLPGTGGTAGLHYLLGKIEKQPTTPLSTFRRSTRTRRAGESSSSIPAHFQQAESPLCP
jgi:tryptophan 2,3-dioxygenase